MGTYAASPNYIDVAEMIGANAFNIGRVWNILNYFGQAWDRESRIPGHVHTSGAAALHDRRRGGHLGPRNAVLSYSRDNSV